MTRATRDERRAGSSQAELGALLATLPVPDIDPALSARTLRRARGELRMRGEGTISVAGFLSLWDASAVPALVLLTGAVYGGLAIARMIEIFT